MSFAKLCCQFGELARHASTLFTLVNYTIAPVRVGLFVANEVPLWSTHEPAWVDPVGGLLRLVSSTSDTLRAVLSQVGTHCRDQLFTLRMHTLLDAADELHARVSILIDNPDLREPTEGALEQARILCTMSANDVIERLSSDDAALEIALRSSVAHDSLQLRGQIGRQLEPFGIGMSRLTEPDRYHLFIRPPENHWGKVTAGEAHWGHRVQLPLRVAYRLTLMLQHWLSALLHRATQPCQPIGSSLAPR